MIAKTLLLAVLAIGVLGEYNLSEETQKKYFNYVEDICKKVGAGDKVDEVKNVFTTFKGCVKSLFDGETLRQEIEDAKPIGALDEVFKKYCAKSPQLKSCIHTMISGATPCLEASYKEHTGAANNATDQLIDFVCFKDGDRIALFIAEQGPECFREKINPIRECGNKLGLDSVDGVKAAQSLTRNEKCGKFDDLTNCVVKALEECSTPTPANMAESLFRFLRKGSPCSSVTKH